MDQDGIVLSALFNSPDHTLTRVQAQKMVFLVDRQLTDAVGGRVFSFAPYHYGPFDKDVYSALERLEAAGLVATRFQPGAGKAYQLTEPGQTAASKIVSGLPAAAASHMGVLGRWVRSLSFRDLVAAIYRSYPEMRARTIFRG